MNGGRCVFGVMSVLGLRWYRFGLIAAVLLALTPVSARAAELKISLAELARILTVTLGDAKLRLHNVPGGMIDLAAGSSLTIGGSSIALPVPARTFVVGGTTYAYYVNDLNSGPITISAVPSALRFTIPFKTDGPALVGKCVTGFCLSDSILPEIQWTKSVVTFDLTPVWINGDLSLDLKQVNIGGTFTPDCNAAGGIFSGGLCDIVLSKARTATRTLKTDLDATLKDKVNAPDVQGQIATGLRNYLKIGPLGQVHISKVTVDSDNVTLTFCLECS